MLRIWLFELSLWKLRPGGHKYCSSAMHWMFHKGVACFELWTTLHFPLCLSNSIAMLCLDNHSFYDIWHKADNYTQFRKHLHFTQLAILKSLFSLDLLKWKHIIVINFQTQKISALLKKCINNVMAMWQNYNINSHRSHFTG